MPFGFTEFSRHSFFLPGGVCGVSQQNSTQSSETNESGNGQYKSRPKEVFLCLRKRAVLGIQSVKRSALVPALLLVACVVGTGRAQVSEGGSSLVAETNKTLCTAQSKVPHSSPRRFRAHRSLRVRQQTREFVRSALGNDTVEVINSLRRINTIKA